MIPDTTSGPYDDDGGSSWASFSSLDSSSRASLNSTWPPWAQSASHSSPRAQGERSTGSGKPPGPVGHRDEVIPSRRRSAQPPFNSLHFPCHSCSLDGLFGSVFRIHPKCQSVYCSGSLSLQFNQGHSESDSSDLESRTDLSNDDVLDGEGSQYQSDGSLLIMEYPEDQKYECIEEPVKTRTQSKEPRGSSRDLKQPDCHGETEYTMTNSTSATSEEQSSLRYSISDDDMSLETWNLHLKNKTCELS